MCSGSAALPATGVSPSFDYLCQIYPPERALQLVMRKAFGLLEGRIESGNIDGLPSDYPMADLSDDRLYVRTSRTLDIKIVEIARKLFDPLGFESKREFGKRLASAALANFFEEEKRV